MDDNPFTAKLCATDEEIEKLQHRRDELVEQVTWASRFNPEEAVDEVARLCSDLEERTAELARLESKVGERDARARRFASQTPAIERDTRRRLGVFRRLTGGFRLAKERRSARRLLPAAKDEVAKLTDLIREKEQALDRFRTFRSAEVDEAIARIDGQLSPLQKERTHLEARAADVERAVEAPLAELRKYESEIEGHKSTISTLKSEVSGLEGQISDAKRLDERLSKAAKSYERAKLHDECERRFGYRSPRAAIRAIELQRRSVDGSIRERQRQIDRIRRDMAKPRSASGS